MAQIDYKQLAARFPQLESDSERDVYFEQELTPEEKKLFVDKNWRPVNILSLPQDSEGEVIRYIKCYMKGVRMGTIIPSDERYKLLELECKTLGISYANKSTDNDENEAKGKLFGDLLQDLEQNFKRKSKKKK